MVQQAIDTFGGLDILVNNAGFVRDRMLVNTSEEEWDAVIRVHLKGHFAPLRHAGAWWRSRGQGGTAAGRPGDQHLVGRGHAGLDRADDVLGGQGRHRRHDAGGGGRAGSLRRERERDRAGRAHPDDRGRLPRDDGERSRGRVRRDGPGQQLTGRGVAGLRGLRRHRPGASRSRAARSASRRAGGTARSRTSAVAGRPTRSAPPLRELVGRGGDARPGLRDLSSARPGPGWKPLGPWVCGAHVEPRRSLRAADRSKSPGPRRLARISRTGRTRRRR